MHIEEDCVSNEASEHVKSSDVVDDINMTNASVNAMPISHVISAILLKLSKFALELYIFYMTYLISRSFLCVVFTVIGVAFTENMYLEKKIPNRTALCTINLIEYINKINRYLPDVIIMLLVVMVALRIAIIYIA